MEDICNRSAREKIIQLKLCKVPMRETKAKNLSMLQILDLIAK